MPDPRAGYANGVPSGRPQPHRPPPSAQHTQVPSRQDAFNRPFTIQEALPYTPFTSIAPIHSDVIPTPNLGSGSPATELTDAVATTDFEALNAELRSGQPPSKRLEQAIASFHNLLDPKRLPEYKFKVSPMAISGAATNPPMANNLSPFSKMVVDQTSVAFRYPTPDTPGLASTNGHSVSPVMAKQKSPVIRKADKPKQSPKQSSIAELNRQAHAQNAQNAARFEIILPTKKQFDKATAARATGHSVGAAIQSLQETPGAPAASAPLGPSTPSRPLAIANEPIADSITVTPQKDSKQASPVPVSESARPPPQSLGTPSKGIIAIELPRAKSFNRNEYLVVPDTQDEPDSLSSRKRKREEYDSNRDILGQSLGHRERSNAAFNDLLRCFQEVFNAEQNLLDYRSNNELVYFSLDGEPTLSSAAQQKVQSLLGKSIELDCFKQVPLDDLLHIVRLSEGSLKHAESLDLKLDETWGSSEVELWLQLLPDVDSGLKAARTTLRMMCGGREDKQLYSEGTIELALNLFKHVLDGIIVPLAELRNTSEVFKLLSHHRDRIAHVLTTCQRLFTLMTTLISTIDTSETVMNTLEFAASRLVFIETAHSEKDSVVEIHRFDGLRLVAMDMLSQVFLLNPAQRQGIFDDILTSLEKLPVGKQRARQFKLVDGTSIQPVSALIMRLVQASAGKVDDLKAGKHGMDMLSMETNDGEDVARHGGSTVPNASFTVNTEEEGANNHSAAVQELQDVVSPLMDSARGNAGYVINFIVKRALKSTKTGDTPYRNLLDLFVEDFTSCLNNPDWPAAELLLRILMSMMVNIVNGEKSSAPSKNMALEVLGVICAAISKLRSYVRKTASSLDGSEGGDLGMFLVDLGLAALTRKNRPELIVSWAGPYRATLESLEERHSDDPHLGSAISFLISDWADNICKCYNNCEDDDDERDQKYGQLAYRLRMMIHDRRWLVHEYSFKSVSGKLARLAYAITLLRSQLCEAFTHVLNLLLGSMTSDQATVRSKSLRSINQLLETDPSILDGDSVVIQRILQCLVDSSTQVRDSALGLVGKCISMRPALEDQMTETVIERFTDTGVGVRKRAMKLAKDIYLRNPSKAVRSDIANALLHRVQDPEESVRDLARQMIEEIWFAPFHKGENSAASKISLADHVALMVQTVKRGSVNLPVVLDKVLQSMLAPDSKSAPVTSEVCAKFVESMFDMVNNSDSDDSTVAGSDALQVLMIFAKADPSLFNFEQISLLKPFIESIDSADNVAVMRAVIVIYRRVLPQLSKAHTHFLEYVRSKLTPAIGKLPRLLLDDVFACLWIISVLLESKEHLTRLVVSVLRNITKMRSINPKQMTEINMRQFDRYCLLAGMAGKHCDLDSHLQVFRTQFPKWNGTSVSKLMVDTMVGFAAPQWPLDLRKASLDAVGLVCQSWPKNYNAPNVYTAFRQVFDEQNPVLELMILRGLKEFYLIEEQRSELAKAEETPGKAADTPKKRELTVMGGTSHDDAASGTTQRFLKDITRICLATQDELAFLAIEVLASINRQGIVHPKETGVTFMTLETSPIPKFSEIAYLGHKMLHEKHESAVEREYGRALQAAFAYQRDIVKDPRGATTNPFVAKIHLWMEVLKVSNSQKKQKFLEKLCNMVDFDLAKLDVAEEVPAHLQFSQFLIENMAFLEYNTVGELQAVVAAAEKMFSTTGAPVAHAIESEVLQMRMDFEPSTQVGADGQVAPAAPTVDIMRLKQLTAASMVLLALWEARTYLRRLYGMGTTRRDPKAKAQAKDLNKTPVKVQGVTGEKFWEDIAHVMTSLSSRERMTETCRSFVELMNVDRELKIADEDEELNGEDPTTPSNDDEDDEPGSVNTPARGRKRKASGTPSGRKKRARSSSQPRKRGRPKKQNIITADVDAEGEVDDGDWF
ncbi:ARM repeat-containing protein [Coniochaeta sp. PMI_546]|nr:ARM repeat-containing protein [Coniochaeta sp. PMI_546]